MARERMTTRRSRSATQSILADIDALERQMDANDTQAGEKPATAGIDEELSSWADGIAKEERSIAEKSTGENTGAAIGGQNGKANDNWPTNSSELSKEERLTLATELTMLSKGMVKKIASGGLSQDDRTFVAQRLLKAAKRYGKV